MTISRGQMPRQLYLGGGITQLPMDQMMVPRGQYGLGSLVKSVRAVGDFAKSDIGKLALLYAGTAGLGALGAGSAGTGFKFFGPQSFLAPSNVLSNLVTSGKNLGLLKRVVGTADMGTMSVRDGFLQKAFSKIPGGGTTGILAASILPSLFGGPEEAKTAFSRDPEGVRNYLIQYFKNLNKDATDEEARAFAESQTREYAAGGGIMGLPMGEMRENKAGVMERDYREEGGFVPVGIKEKADDVPAMLSKNEFVFTADAVRGAGDGNVEKGAQRLYNTMKTLENGGTV